MRRLFIIIAGVIVLLGVIVAVYFIFFAGNGASLSVGNPFANTGTGNASPSGDLPTTDGTVSNAGTTLGPRFVKITDGPVAAGTVAFDIQGAVPDSSPSVSLSGSSTSATSTIAAPTPDVEIRFIDRASGNVYSYIDHARTLARISNKTLPGIQRASWIADGSRAYAQFVSTSAGSEQVSTYALDANGGGGYLLENNLTQASVAGTSTLFTLLSGTTGSVGTIALPDGSNSRTLFSSVLSSLLVHPTDGNLFATNKASGQLDGFAFSIDRKTGVFSRILGAFRGLTVLPNQKGTQLVYSYTSGGTYQLRILDVASRSSTALPVATLSEKCVWARNSLSVYCAVPTNLQGNLPDDWYQGAITFTDRIWKIDLSQRVATLVVDPSQIAKTSVDAVNLAIDPNEDVLVFQDKHTGALYAYDL